VKETTLFGGWITAILSVLFSIGAMVAACNDHYWLAVAFGLFGMFYWISFVCIVKCDS